MVSVVLIDAPKQAFTQPKRRLVMAGKTLTRLDLAEAVARNCEVRKPESIRLVDNVLEVISKGLVEDGEVKLSSFAILTVNSKPPRVGRNPKTGEEQPISSRRVIRFRASQNMKTRVAAENKP